ncbi:20887_t:CDS:2, partial [Gigaspora margarita]
LGEVPAKEKLFVVDVTENISTISHLQSAIKKGKEPDLDHFASNSLTLWKVNIPINNEDRLKMLDVASCKINIEQDLGGIKLFPADEIPKDFYEQQPPSVKILHIIIQVPAADQERINIQNRNINYGLGGTILPYSADHKTFEGISLNNPDISYRSKVVFSLVKDLIEEKVLLVRAPPYSGKTSLAQLIEYHLVNSSEYSSKYRIIRVSMLWGLIVGMDCSWETFGDVWRRIIGVSWVEWIEQCQQAPTILILDEIQMIYKQERGIDENKKLSADAFWRTIKGCLQEMPNIYIIMFGVYGYHSANSAGISTPVEIPLSKCKGLLNIIFNQEELKEHVEKFCKKYFPLDNHGISEFYNIFERIQVFSEDELKLCESVYLNGAIPHQSGKRNLALIKSGATFACDGYIDFYVDELNWAIEILREGKDMAMHHRRFEPAGEYKEITKYAKSIAIIDIRSGSKRVRKLQKDFIYVSYSEDFYSFKIESFGEDTVIIRFKD